MNRFHCELSLSVCQIDSFWSRVEKTCACWLWRGRIQHNGYGTFGVKTPAGFRPILVHRISYFLLHGRLTQDLCVCHSCDVKLCVRPDHLFEGTYRDNMRDASQKGRMAIGNRNGSRLHPERLARGPRPNRKGLGTGSRNGRYTHPERTVRGDRVNTAKLTWAQVADIRQHAAEGMRAGTLASIYGVSAPNVRRILAGKYWKPEFAPCHA